jgi:MYXO-CTERM domain-containing protein
MRTALVALALTLTAFALARPTPASACSCMQQTPEQAAEQADAIFEGRVLTVDAPDPPEQTEPVHVTIRVAQQWKGIESEEVEVTTAANSAMCGYNFEVDEVYLVYASRGEDGQLQVSLCSRTQLADQATEDRAHLGPATTPVDPTVEDPGMPGSEEEPTTEGGSVEGEEPQAAEGGGCGSCAASGPSGATALPFLLALFGLRRRR